MPTPPNTAVPDTAAQPGALRVDTGEFIVVGTARVGDVVPGTVEVTVTDTRADSTGWTTDVKVTAAHGRNGNVFSPGPGSYYRAQNTQCSESEGEVRLHEEAVVVATASEACPSATWTAMVGIGVPSDADPGDYSLTITHSVY